MSSSSGLSNTPIDPLAGIDPSTPQDAQREHIAAIVRGDGMSITDANALLAARGFAPLNTNSNEYAEGQKVALLRDSDFMARYSRGDASAIAALYQADLRISQSSGKLTDRAPSSNDERFDQLRNIVYQNERGEGAAAVADHVAGIAASLHLDSENAKAMAELSYEADRSTANMTADERATWGEWELQSLRSALGPDADQKLKVASKVLTRFRGKPTDVAATTRESGARIGLQLISIAQVQAHKNKW